MPEICFLQLFEDIRIISEIHAFYQNTIYHVTQAGVDYSTLCSFQTLILPSELEKYLSLFCTYCREISIRYKDYTVVTGNQVLASPSLIIEKITPDNSLFLKVVYSISGFDPEFSDQFDLTHVVIVLDQEKKMFLLILVKLVLWLRWLAM